MVAQILLPLPIEGTFSYLIPEELEGKIKEGNFVVIQFGKRHFYIGIVVALLEGSHLSKEGLKPIEALLPDHPSISREELNFWQWMASYYMVSQGTIMRLALPKTLLPESETLICINRELLENYTASDQATEEGLARLYEYGKEVIPFDEVISLLGKGGSRRYDKLVEAGIFVPKEALSGFNKAIGIPQIAFSPQFQSDEALQQLLDSKRRQPARKALIERLVLLQEELNLPLWAAIDKTRLIDKQPNRNTQLRQLIEEGILSVSYAAPNVEQSVIDLTEPVLLSDEEKLRDDKPNLFVAHSFTEETAFIVKQLQYTLSRGHSALLILPPFSTIEGNDALFSLFPELKSFPLVFFDGNANDLRRAKAIKTIKESTTPLIIVGHRPAAFAPLTNVGLITIFEEQDPYYKQRDGFPRYHARDMLVWRALQAKIPLLLTSINPSLDSIYNTEVGKWQLINSIPSAAPRAIEVIDLKRERKIRRLLRDRIISVPLKETMKQVIAQKGKVLIITPQKGFAPYLLCPECGESPKCIHCDVSLTYHRRLNRLVCRYCGFSTSVPSYCPSCQKKGKENIEWLRIGYGSERVENELTKLFPNTHIVRIDAETTARTSRRAALRQTIYSGEGDIYLGTQMITRISSLEGVKLIVFSELDKLTSIPYFRIDEEVFDLCYVLSMRYPEASFLFQTTAPNHPIIDTLRNGQRLNLLKALLDERKFLRFAPVYRMIRIEMKATNRDLLIAFAERLSERLRALPHFIQVDGPIEPFVSRVKLRYIRHIVLKLNSQYSSTSTRQSIQHTVKAIQQQACFKQKVSVAYDVDPY